MNLISKIATAGAVAAMGLGLGAAGASANITVDPNPYEFTGSQEGINSFTAGDSTVECEDATFTGNTSNSSTNTIPFHAEYAGCTVDFGLFTLSATVATNSDWDLRATSGSAASSVTADVNLLAPPGGGPAVTITVAGICTISIPAQSNLSHVVASNVSPTAVTIDATVSNIAYTASGLCPGIPSSGSDAAYEGQVLIPGITMTGSF